MIQETEQNLCSEKMKGSPSEHCDDVAIVFKETKLGGSSLSTFLCFIYSRDSHIRYIFGLSCLKLPTVRLVSFSKTDLRRILKKSLF